MGAMRCVRLSTSRPNRSANCDDRRFDNVYIFDGRTDSGRALRLIFQDRGNGIARVFTGWELKRKKKRKL